MLLIIPGVHVGRLLGLLLFRASGWPAKLLCKPTQRQAKVALAESKTTDDEPNPTFAPLSPARKDQR